MRYRIDLGGVAQRQLRLTLEVQTATLELTDGHAEFFVPVWTPGSYLVREYAQHVSAVSATGDGGLPLPVTKRAKNRWAVEVGTSESLRVCWSVYAHELTVRTSYVTDELAFWNGACVALWPVGGQDRPVGVEVLLPGRWELFAGSLELQRREASEPGDVKIVRFDCRDLDEFVDTPCLAGPISSWQFDVGGREHRFVPVGLAGIEPPPSFGGDVQRIVETAAAVFGGDLPFERYTFLALFGVSGRGGLEHADSSVLLAPRTTFRPRTAYEDFLALVAHEYLHAWNVKRMRPRALWSIDLERENYTGLLWVAEGFTAYYDDLIVRRAGLSTPTAYLERLATHVSAWRANPGRRAQSLAEASFDAWMLLYRPGENTRNVTQNYYTNGALAAFVFDAELRRCSGGARNLDDALRELWRRSWLAEPSRGFDLDDVIAAIDRAAGTSLEALVRGTVESAFEPDLERALGLFGLRLVFADDGPAFVGARFRVGETTIASLEADSPGWEAGLCPGDEVIAVEGLRVRHDSWQTVWDQVSRPGQVLCFTIARQGILREIGITPTARTERGTKIVSLVEPSESQLAQREAWLGSRELRG